MTVKKTKKLKPMVAKDVVKLIKSGDFHFLGVETGALNGDGPWTSYVLVKLASPWGGERYAVAIHPLEPTPLGWRVKYLGLDLANVAPKGQIPALLGRLGPKILPLGAFSVDDDDGEVRWELTDLAEPGGQEERVRFVLQNLPAILAEASKHICRITIRATTSGHIDLKAVDALLEGKPEGAEKEKDDSDTVAGNYDLV
jgi:hypothetical protein